MELGWEEVFGIELSKDAINKANSFIKKKIYNGSFESNNYKSHTCECGQVTENNLNKDEINKNKLEKKDKEQKNEKITEEIKKKNQGEIKK